jgi:hypothetical protein
MADPVQKNNPNPANSGEQVLKAAVAERKRIPMSIPKAKLSVPEIPGYHLHWINDYAGRVAQAIQGGYDFVDESEGLVNSFSLGTASDLSGNSDLGTRVSVVVGKNEDGSPLRAYLMKIKEEWFQEDQAVGQERVNAVDQQIRRGQVGADKEGAADRVQRYVRTADFKANARRT